MIQYGYLRSDGKRILHLHWPTELPESELKGFANDFDEAQFWYPQESCSWWKGLDKRIVSFIHQKQTWGVPSMTGVIDLSCTAEEIIGGFSSTYRYEVKRAKRDGVYCTYTDNPSEEELGSFISWYDEFARSKGLPDIDKGNIRLLAEIGNLGLSSAYDKEGILLCRHSYLMDRKIKRAALHTSASLAHTISDSRQRNLIGMANRYLHYFDMLWQKENGFLKYDFGGLDWTD